ncbi:bifunctional hydroxymethylpyrimidine kinase/phosphomethylpyrimidine kinase [Chengkuizengella sediminis]|uniref:bifunctional hydroxymethylpyrimidine kinase/phosphomethylpyrimidine kinase n=1 Tax=Chengkuizengella sediminis TaxID=1885917 RepID=UPI00138A1916|nr:bifunctional hydroxymethylpyrimidine kinase/phosphomethylpyrimidine kinase [Chengkuizengella sediminis]NDI34892.1 bifunctional hydroxymethylpyrimidine kinase/phosphomethylpyrimidine kinase [Chengkuizengella sediminis]
MKPIKVLTIAGSDSGGGAGIQADLKTFQELEVFGMSAITAITAQNTLGVQGVYPSSLEAVANQIDSIGTDMGADAIKTGMLFNSEMIGLVCEKIKQYGWENVVVDPVMIAKGGAPLLQEEAVKTMREQLIPLSKVITPNMPEAEALTGRKIQSLEDRKEAAKMLYDLGAQNVVIKGGHDTNSDEVIDLLFDGTEFTTYQSKRINTKNTHGTGCTFAAAVASELAKERSIKEAVGNAKKFVHVSIVNAMQIGSGHGPLNHAAHRTVGEYNNG